MAIDFCHRMGTGLGAGADMMKLLRSEASQGNSAHRAAVNHLVDGVKAGEQMSDLMACNPYFPRLMAAMVRVGEETGKLEHTLLTLCKHYQQQQDTRRWFINSISWPALQLVAGIGIVSILILLLGILSSGTGGPMDDILGFGLTGPNGVLWFWFYIALVGGLLAFLIWGYMRNLGGIHNLAPFVYAIPVVGPSIQTITLSRFCWTLSLSLGSGLDPIRSVNLSLDSTASDYYRSGSRDAETAVRNGATLTGMLKATSLFPKEFLQRIEVAEHSGTDAESIEFLTREYEERARRAIKVLAGTATVLIRVIVMGLLIFLIFRLASTYIGALNGASEPINPHSRFGN